MLFLVLSEEGAMERDEAAWQQHMFDEANNNADNNASAAKRRLEKDDGSAAKK